MLKGIVYHLQYCSFVLKLIVIFNVIYVSSGFSISQLSRLNNGRSPKHRFHIIQRIEKHDEFQFQLHESTVINESKKSWTPSCKEKIKHEAISEIMANNDAFSVISSLAAISLLESERKRFILEKNSAVNWLDDESAVILKEKFDELELKLADQRSGIDRDEAGMWIRWMKSSPAPTIIELSHDFRAAANSTLLTFSDVENISNEILDRLGVRLILLPSGSQMRYPIITPAGSIIYGKLLYGGVERFRPSSNAKTGKPARKLSSKTIIKSSVNDYEPAWTQYGGPHYKYEALDMGAAAVLELTLQPRETKISNLLSSDQTGFHTDMALSRLLWSPHSMFSFTKNTNNVNNNKQKTLEALTTPPDDANVYDRTAMSLSGVDRNQAFEKSFQSSVGGLQPQIQAIVRRVLDGRVIRPAETDYFIAFNETNTNAYLDSTSSSISAVALEAEELALLGLSPVKGLLLYGPPGCGKTALAREISKALKARKPKIISAPELLDRWVGGSERLVRDLFAEAEAELAACNQDATKSALHVIVIDEIDAVFRTRSTKADDSGESTRSSVVNQILSKLDGVNAIPNVLLIGMTNRRELLDEALLRPGRLEVQIEIPLPNKQGRREILQIHFDALRKRGRLSKPLCLAIDGVREIQSHHDTIDDHTGKGFKKLIYHIYRVLPLRKPVYDLASDAITSGFSGADLAGLVRCAGSIALSRAREDGGGVDALMITLDDVKDALTEISK